MSQTINKLQALGQSIWCDNLGRAMIDGGELQRLIDLGITGVTSNPTIFMKAITGGSDYDERIRSLDADSDDVMKVYEGLVIPDIVDAADLLRPVYDRTKGADGYVSLEVNPALAYKTEATVAEARRLHRAIDRPNVLIKVPATHEGLPAIETLISEGISVNVTLIFSIAMHQQVMEAYLRGLKHLARREEDLSKVTSVASFFVSRLDTIIDRLLKEKGDTYPDVERLMGRAGIANARLAYERFREMFNPEGAFAELAARGARVQRPLWASTSVKDPRYPDTMYVDGLIGPDTVNTLPPQTIEAVLDHGKAEVTLGNNLDEARKNMAALGNLDIDMRAVTDQLTREGVDLFARSFDELLISLGAKESRLRPVG